MNNIRIPQNQEKYYLFTYVCIDPLSWAEDVVRRTDQNLALFRMCEGELELVYYMELERFSGIKKHDISFKSVAQCKKVINELLNVIGMSLDRIDVIWGCKEIEKGVDEVTKRQIEDFFSKVNFYPHQCYHLFSSLQINTEKSNMDMLSYALDGGPDFLDVLKERNYYYPGCFRKNGKLSFFPAYSPGPIWTLAKNYFGIKEGTLMALASACKTELKEFNLEPPLLCKQEDFIEAYKYFRDLVEYAKLAFKTNKVNGLDLHFSKEECLISCVMKEIQKASLYIMDKNIELAKRKYNISDFSNCILGLSGGFALNCPTNTYVMKKYNFADYMSPPCVNDSGISLGMGLFFFYMNNNKFIYKLGSAYHGYDGTDFDLKQCAELFCEYIKNIYPFDAHNAGKDIQNGPLVWIEGAAEIGPRALGHRSVIADPRKMNNKLFLNKCKGRPDWQPVAPLVLDKHGEKWFNDYFYSPFMLHVFTIREGMEVNVPAISHMDKTARIQSLKEDDSRIYKALEAFYEQTGIPMVCNTSLNDRGEPIINTICEAFNFALRKGIRLIYYDGNRIELKNHSHYCKTDVENRKLREEFLKNEEDAAKIREMMNPMRLSKEILHYYFTSPSLMRNYDISIKTDAEKVRRMINSIFINSQMNLFLE